MNKFKILLFRLFGKKSEEKNQFERFLNPSKISIPDVDVELTKKGS